MMRRSCASSGAETVLADVDETWVDDGWGTNSKLTKVRNGVIHGQGWLLM